MARKRKRPIEFQLSATEYREGKGGARQALRSVGTIVDWKHIGGALMPSGDIFHCFEHRQTGNAEVVRFTGDLDHWTAKSKPTWRGEIAALAQGGTP